MRRTQSTVRVADVPAIIADPDRGTISLIGDHGGLSLITGEVYDSMVIPGTLAFETEHGTVRLEQGAEVKISEAYPSTLTPETKRDTEWLISWTINGENDSEDPSSPMDVASHVWRETFGRRHASAEDACVFEVMDNATGETVTVDLSEHRLTR